MDVIEVIEMELEIWIDKALFCLAADAAPFRRHLAGEAAEVSGLGNSVQSEDEILNNKNIGTANK